MSLSDQWTLGYLRTVVRRELMDTGGRWWTDAELNEYLGAWQDYLQDKFECVYNTATITTTTNTITLTNVALDILRVDAVYWSDPINNMCYRLVGRDKEDELEILQRDWRVTNTGLPQAIYQDDIYSVSIWPPIASTIVGTMVFEYPKIVTFGGDNSFMQVPAWMKYSAKNYAAYRAYVRPGPNNDLRRADRYKAKFDRQIKRYITIHEQHFPDKYLSLRPMASRYEGDILNVGKHNTLYRTWA